MVIIALLALLLALYPSIGFVFFRLVLLERMESVTLEDFNKYRAGRDSDYPSEDKLRRVFRESFSVGVFLVPVLFLTLLYAFAFLMITAVYGYWADSLLMFPERFLLAIQPVLLAFVGVYVFNMGHSLRRLYLYDLTENVFWGAVYRTLLSLALATVLAVLNPVQLTPNTGEFDRIYFASFFFIGFVTNRFFRGLLDFIGRKVSYFAAGSSEEIPLSAIQGISIWNEYRLEEEGIDNVQHLATCDVVPLAIRTRYELRTLLDWVDQAILYHSLGRAAAETLQRQGLILGAIDFAYGEETLATDKTPITKIAGILDRDEFFVKEAMKSLHDDAHLDEIWNLWLKPTDD